MTQYSSRLEAAIGFALYAHEGQTRKGTDLPYISHLFHVTLILQRYGFDEETLLAGLLHDTVEDCDVSHEDLVKSFGRAVADIVEQVTELPQSHRWEKRKDLYLKGLESACEKALAVATADKIHNLMTITESAKAGEDVWSRFNRGREQTLEYYERVLELLRRRFPHPIVDEFAATFELAKSV